MDIQNIMLDNTDGKGDDEISNFSVEEQNGKQQLNYYLKLDLGKVVNAEGETESIQEQKEKQILKED